MGELRLSTWHPSHINSVTVLEISLALLITLTYLIPLFLLLLMLECQQQKSCDCSTQPSTHTALVLCPWPHAGMGTYLLTNTGTHKLTNLPLAG